MQTAEIKKFLDHAGQSLAFFDDNADSLFGGFPIHRIVHQCFCPAFDGGERGSQFVGNGGDKVIFHLFVFLKLQRHSVDGFAQFADFVIGDFVQMRGKISL